MESTAGWDWLAERFESNRGRLKSVAFRMLGSGTEAEDAVQEAWLRLTRVGPDGIDNLEGWLTTVVARVCLDVLRSKQVRREEPLDVQPATAPVVEGPEEETLLADAVGPALLAVLATLQPAERVAFVLHDTFAVPFEEIAAVLGRSPEATRQLASRARRRVRGVDTPEKGAESSDDFVRRRELAAAFLAASREGNFAALLEILDPGVVLRADAAAVRAAQVRQARGAPALEEELRGPDAVVRVFLGGAQAAQLALADGSPCLAWAPGGHPRAVFLLGIKGNKITEIEIVSSPERVRQLDVALL